MHNMALIFLGGMGAIVVLQRYFESKRDTVHWSMKVLTKVGEQSLSIYLIHYFFIPDVSSSMQVFLNANNPFIWQLTFAFMLAIPITTASMFIGKLMEANKYLNLLFYGKIFK